MILMRRIEDTVAGKEMIRLGATITEDEGKWDAENDADGKPWQFLRTTFHVSHIGMEGDLTVERKVDKMLIRTRLADRDSEVWAERALEELRRRLG